MDSSTERRWSGGWPITPVTISADWIVTVPHTVGIHPKMLVTFVKSVLPPAQPLPPVVYSVFQVLNPTQFIIEVVDPKTRKAEKPPIAYSGGSIFITDGQVRNSEAGEVVNRNTYEEEPAMARRVIQVSPWGNPIDTGQGAIEIQSPVTRFIYNACCELQTIREFAPIRKIYTGNANFVAAGSTVQLDAIYNWMQKDVQFVVVYGGLTNAEKLFTIQSVDLNTFTITTVEPIVDATGTVFISGGIGDRVKTTNFMYTPCCEVSSISEGFDIVNLNDILGK